MEPTQSSRAVVVPRLGTCGLLCASCRAISHCLACNSVIDPARVVEKCGIKLQDGAAAWTQAFQYLRSRYQDEGFVCVELEPVA